MPSTSNTPTDSTATRSAQQIVEAFVSALERLDYDAAIALAGDDMTAIGQGLHAVIAAELINPGRADALARAQALLAGVGVEPYIRTADALAAAQRFARWLEVEYRAFQPPPMARA